MRTIDNFERGCGTLKKGGFYAQGKPRSNGMLANWTWLLGTGLMTDACTGDQPIITCPPRQIMVFNLLGSLMTGQRLQDYPEDMVSWFNQHPGIPAKALLDHAGSIHYPNPAEFAEEVMARGPSRKIPQSLARTLVKYTPLPIVFTHSTIPMAEDAEQRTEIVNHLSRDTDWYETPKEIIVSPTWVQPGFGFTVRDNRGWGNDHWQTILMQEVSADSYLEILQGTETIFGVSWITEITYVAKDDDNPDFLSDLFADGIESVRIED